RGSIPYSAVTQPRIADLSIHFGASFSTDAVTSTQVFPKRTSADPSAYGLTPATIWTGLSCLSSRPSGRGDTFNPFMTYNLRTSTLNWNLLHLVSGVFAKAHYQTPPWFCKTAWAI